MATTPKVYVICDSNCKWEGMTKEQILTAITNAVQTGEIGDINTGFVQTIKTINNMPLRFFVGTQAEYNALSKEDKQNLYAIISDDETLKNMEKIVEEAQEIAASISSGHFVAPHATEADSAYHALQAEHAETATNATYAENAQRAEMAVDAEYALTADNARSLGKSVWKGKEPIGVDYGASITARENLFDRFVSVEIAYYLSGKERLYLRTPQFRLCDSLQYYVFAMYRTAGAQNLFNISINGKNLLIESIHGGEFYLTNVFVEEHAKF